jgi:hypothetical protein
MGKFPPIGAVFSRLLAITVSVGHCKTQVSREACEPKCSDTAPLGARMFIRSTEIGVFVCQTGNGAVANSGVMWCEYDGANIENSGG